MIPTLFPSDATVFTSQGLGGLPDAISCIVEEERNGAFELSMEYPITGENAQYIQLRSIIVAAPNPSDIPQPFRVYEILANMSGTITVNAAHLSYDMSGIPVQPFSAASMADALQKIVSNAVVDCPFTLTTDKTVASPMEQTTPASMRSLCGGVAGSLLDRYGGEWKWNGYTASLLLHRGSDNGVVIKYGKNLTDLEQEKSCAEVYTGVYPYWVSQDGLTVVQLPERIITAATNDAYILDTEAGQAITTEDDVDLWLSEAPVDSQRIMMLDLSQSEEEAQEGEVQAPTVAELRQQAQDYINKHDIFEPKVALKVSFEQLADTEEYADIALLEAVNLCDTVHVEFADLGISSTAKIVKTTYNVLLERYDSVEIGSARTNIADTIATMQGDIDTATSDAYSSLNAVGGNITGDLTVGGTTSANGRFEHAGADVALTYPGVWRNALRLGWDIIQYADNGMTVDCWNCYAGCVVNIYGSATSAADSTFTLAAYSTVDINGLILSAAGATCGRYSLSGDTLTVTMTTTSTSASGQFIIVGG